MSTNVGGDLLDLGARWEVTAGANLAQDTLVDLAGTVPSSAAECTGGVAVTDCASGDTVPLKLLGAGILRIVATGTVTAGLKVEVLQGTKYANINGTSTSVTIAGVQNVASGYPTGRAITGGSAGDTVLVNTFAQQAKS